MTVLKGSDPEALTDSTESELIREVRSRSRLCLQNESLHPMCPCVTPPQDNMLQRQGCLRRNLFDEHESISVSTVESGKDGIRTETLLAIEVGKGLSSAEVITSWTSLLNRGLQSLPLHTGSGVIHQGRYIYVGRRSTQSLLVARASHRRRQR
jgi:hypothetical protein